MDMKKTLLDKYLGLSPLITAERSCALTEIVASAEYLAQPGDRRPGGLNDWTRMQYQLPETHISRAWNSLDREHAEQAYRAIHALRIIHAGILATGRNSNAVRAWCNVFLVGSHLALQPRQFLGTDGSDQLSFLTNAAAAVGRLGGSATTRKAASDFLALQVVLSYFVAGAVKAPGARWKNGDALQKIMGTETYGDKAFYQLLRRSPSLGRRITKGTVIFETLFPLALADKKLLKAMLVLFGSFHIANAKFMGLGRFILPFVATYPAIWALSTGNIDGTERSTDV